MRNRRIMVLLSVIVLLGIAVLPAGAEGMKRYDLRSDGFSISFPADWEIQKGFSGTAIMGISPLEGPNDDFRENLSVMVSNIPEGNNLETFTKLNLDAMKSVLSKYKEHKVENTTVSGLKAKKIIYDFEMEGQNIRTLLYIIIKGKKGYFVTSGSSLKRFKEHQPLLEKLSNTIKIN